jgi:hypothetical protein
MGALGGRLTLRLFEQMFYTCPREQVGLPRGHGTHDGRLEADQSRPIDDPEPVLDFPKYGKPLVHVSGIYGRASARTRKYGLTEWLDSSGMYHLRRFARKGDRCAHPSSLLSAQYLLGTTSGSALGLLDSLT